MPVVTRKRKAEREAAGEEVLLLAEPSPSPTSKRQRVSSAPEPVSSRKRQVEPYETPDRAQEQVEIDAQLEADAEQAFQPPPTKRRHTGDVDTTILAKALSDHSE